VSLHNLVKCQCLKATTDNKSSVATHFKELTTGNNVFVVSNIVLSNCRIPWFYIKCSIYPLCFWTTQLAYLQKLFCFQLLL